MPADIEHAGLESRVGSTLSRFVLEVSRRRRLVLLFCLILFMASLGFTIRDLGIRSDKNALFPDDLPFRLLDERLFEAFPQLDESIVIVLEGDDAEATRRAAHRLAAALENDAEHFRDVYLPAGPFFETNGLLYLEVDELEVIADRLARLQPMLAEVVRDPTLPGLLDPLGKALSTLGDDELSDIDLAPILVRIESTFAAAEEGRAARLDWSEIVTWGDDHRDLLRQVIYVLPRLDYGSMAAAEGAIHALRDHARALDIGGAGSAIRLRATGDMMLNFEEMQLLRTQVKAAGVASFAIVAGLLFSALRSGRLVFATVSSLLFGLVCTAFFATLAIGHLNMISVAFAVLFIGLGVDFGIHLCMRFQELALDGADPEAALLEATRGVGSSLVLCAVTTSIGFFAFVPTDFIGVAELGVIAGFGMFIALGSSFTIIPAMLAGMAPTARRVDATSRPVGLPVWPARFPRTVVVTALGVAVVAGLAVPKIRFDQNPLGVRDPAAESVKVYQELLAESSASPWSLNYLARTEDEARRIALRFEALPEVEEARTLRDFVPDDQATKLAIIQEMSLFADWTSIDRLPRATSTADRLRSLETLRIEIDGRDADSLAPDIDRAASALHSRLSTLDAELERSSPERVEARLLDLEARLLDRFEDPLRRLERALEARPFGLEGLPRRLRERMISSEGIVRVEILPASDLTDDVLLDRFVDAVRTVSSEVAGPAVSIHDSARAVVDALRQAFGAALVVILSILILLWRRAGDVLLVVVPLLWAGLVTGLAMVCFEIDFNFADVIVLPLLLGIGVDSGIHMVHRSRIEGGEGESLLATSTARAVVFSALTTIASFGSLALVPHLGMASLGRLLVIGVCATVVANLILLPALLQLRMWRPLRRSSSS